MDGTDFLNVAEELANAGAEAHWRSSISRSYYAAFHHLKDRLWEKKGFAISTSALGHAELRDWFMDQSASSLARIGDGLNTLRTKRNEADYRLTARPVPQNDAQLGLAMARLLIKQVQKLL